MFRVRPSDEELDRRERLRKTIRRAYAEMVDAATARGMTLTEICTRTGFSQGYVTNILTHENYAPSAVALLGLVDALGCRVKIVPKGEK